MGLRNLCSLTIISLVQLSSSVRSLSTPPSTLILIDPFTEYLSGHCKEYCNEHDIRVVEVVSSYSNGALESKGMALPINFVAPKDGDEVAWAESEEINLENCCVVAESDAGVPTAERIASNLNLRGNGLSPHLRNKYLTNERARDNGLEVVRQSLAHSWEEAEEFLDELWAGESSETVCVVKPYRGVASDGVYLCRSKQAAKEGFEALLGQPQFGGGLNEAVLIQEYVTGQEYAVDTVSKDGEIKVVALWRYRKKAANGAPFVYECSELVPCASEEEQTVSDYCVEVLRALGVKWGPTHTEIMATAQGPRLIEVNARFHAQHFYPLSRTCLGYDALTATMDSYFNPEIYDSLPDRPETLNSNGLIMHLVSNKKGTVTKINHVQEIKGMESVKLLEIEAKIGDQVVETINIRTDSGYVLLENVDSEALQRDYNRILDLQETMFEVEDDGEKSSEVQQEEATAPPVSKSRRRRRAHITDQDTVAREIPEKQLFEELPRQQEGLMQSFGSGSGSGSVQQRGQLQGSDSPVTALLARLKQKLSKIAVRASAILAGYCVALYAAAIVLPLIC